MNNFILIAKASFKRDYENYLTYKFNIFGELFFNLIVVFMLFYVSFVFKDSSSEYLQAYNNNYFLFLLTGLMVILFLSRSFSSLPMFISTAQSLGYFESILSSKANIFSILLTSILFPMFLATVRVIALFIFSYLFDPNYLNFFSLIEIIFVLVFTSIPFVGISLAICSVIIIYKRANFINSLFLLGCSIFSGIFYPINVMPSIFQNLSLIFPSTYSVNLVRGRIIEDLSYLDMIGDILSIFFISIAYLSIGIYLIYYSIRLVKKNGSISHY